jgi:hypothetical protein
MKVYISYDASDLDVVKQIATTLSKAKHDVWLDYERLSPGDNWAEKVGEGLKQSDAIITVISPDAMKSRFVRADIEYALTAPRLEGRLIPVLVKPTKDIPWILTKINLIDATRKPATAGEQVISALKQPNVHSR